MTTHSPANCAGCAMSRRHFLGSSATGLAATAFAAMSPGAHLDIRSSHPEPQVRIVHVVIRHQPDCWTGWPGTAYDLEGHRKDYARKFAEAAKRAGVELEQRDAPVEDEAALNAFVEELKTKPPQAVLVNLQYFDAWPWTDRIADAGMPTIVFAPTGMSFMNNVRSIAPRPGMHVIASADVSRVEQAFKGVTRK